MDKAGLIHKSSYLNVTKIFSRSHVLYPVKNIKIGIAFYQNFYVILNYFRKENLFI